MVGIEGCFVGESAPRGLAGQMPIDVDRGGKAAYRGQLNATTNGIPHVIMVVWAD